MRSENWLSALKMGVAGHDGFAGGTGLLDKRVGPLGESIDDEVDLIADVEAEVSGYLFVAATAGVQFEAERADAFNKSEFNEVMNVFGERVIADEGLARFRCVIGGDAVERGAQGRAFFRSQDAGCDQGRCVGFAGGYFVGEKAPVKDDGPLPLFELAVERLAKTAGPHFYGILFVGH
jgi:hypothetical protein